jgi:hypothetical protein
MLIIGMVTDIGPLLAKIASDASPDLAVKLCGIADNHKAF